MLHHAGGYALHGNPDLRLLQDNYQGQLDIRQLAWATYNMAYQRQAGNKVSLDWGIIDATLYSKAFTRVDRVADSHSATLLISAPDAGNPTEQPIVGQVVERIQAPVYAVPTHHPTSHPDIMLD